jgi:hypothetical protein
MPNAPRRSYRRDVTEERAGTLSVRHFSPQAPPTTRTLVAFVPSGFRER